METETRHWFQARSLSHGTYGAPEMASKVIIRVSKHKILGLGLNTPDVRHPVTGDAGECSPGYLLLAAAAEGQWGRYAQELGHEASGEVAATMYASRGGRATAVAVL